MLKVNKPLYLRAGLFPSGMLEQIHIAEEVAVLHPLVFPGPHGDFPHLLLRQMIPRFGAGAPLGKLQPGRADNPRFPSVCSGAAQEMLHDELQS